MTQKYGVNEVPFKALRQKHAGCEMHYCLSISCRCTFNIERWKLPCFTSDPQNFWYYALPRHDAVLGVKLCEQLPFFERWLCDLHSIFCSRKNCTNILPCITTQCSHKIEQIFARMAFNVFSAVCRWSLCCASCPLNDVVRYFQRRTLEKLSICTENFSNDNSKIFQRRNEKL